MGARRSARECALHMMYQWDLRRDDPGELARTFWEVHSQPDSVREFADRLFLRTIDRLEAIDPLIRRFVFAPRFAKAAADLLGVEGVRLYHDRTNGNRRQERPQNRNRGAHGARGRAFRRDHR